MTATFLRFAPLAFVLVVGACATPAPEPVTPEPSVPVAGETPTPPSQTEAAVPRKPPRKKPSAIPTRPINVSVECKFKDETGYGGRLSLEVAEAEVRKFSAEVNIPKRGMCRFDLAGFSQTRSLPTPILSAKKGKCQVRVWEQEDQVTVAFTACATQCSAGAINYLWPILVDRPKGGCS